MAITSFEAPKGLHALVLGASGITGWAIANATLSYPTKDTFERVIGLTSRPLSIEQALLPEDSRLQLHAGLDLSKEAGDIVNYLQKIEGIEETTHVYFASYVHHGWGDEDSGKRKAENVNFIVNAVTAVEKACPKMQFFTYPTGGKWYGFEYGDKVTRTVPVKESDPRIPSPEGDIIFYYPQIDALAKMSEGKAWKFADIRPDAIVGFVPNHNPMNIAEPIALYLSLWKAMSSSLEVPFPGPYESYTHFHSDCSQDQLARFTIYASLHPEKTAGESFNIADVDQPISWEMVWPGICKYFGLKASAPVQGKEELSGEAWARTKVSEWTSWTAKNMLKPKVLENTCWDFMTIIAGPYSNFNRHFDLSKARSIGYRDSVDPVEGYRIAFDRMRAGKIIP